MHGEQWLWWGLSDQDKVYAFYIIEKIDIEPLFYREIIYNNVRMITYTIHTHKVYL